MAEGSPPADANRIYVYLRIRPPKKGEIGPENGTGFLMNVNPDHKSLVAEGGKTYNFDWIFDGEGVQQEDIFQRVTAPVIDNVMKGFWGTTMVYGQTGTGKSFTMCNFDKNQEGLIPRAMRMIFDRVKADTDRKYTILFSFIQIYRDKLQDLFHPDANPTSSPELRINRDADGVSFPGINEHAITDEEHFRQKYEDGHQFRIIRETKMNPESSRGHAALFIQVKSVPRDDPAGENRNGKLFLIDLAGYERFNQTGVANEIMKDEARTINASLLALGGVVSALSERSEHVPWRNAKLTRMLEDAIGGKAKCSIILTAGPSNAYVHETMQTLYFGQRAMSIKTNAKLAVNIDYQKLAKKLQEMLEQANSKINLLEIEATKRQMEREETEARMSAESEALKKRHEDQLQALIRDGASPEKIQELIKANAMEAEIMLQQQQEERKDMEHRHEDALREAEEARAEETQTGNAERESKLKEEIARLTKELEHEKEERGKYYTLAKDAEGQARRLTEELSDAKMALLKNGIVVAPRAAAAEDSDSPVAMAAAMATRNLSGLSNDEINRVIDQRLNMIKAMMEEAHAVKIQEATEPLQEELARVKRLYDDLRESADEELQTQKDALSTMYEEELQRARSNAMETQDKLKKNHATIKRSYMLQKEALQEENEQLMKQVADLTERIGNGTGVAPALPPGASGRAPSVAELMIQKKQSDKKAEDLMQTIADLRADIEYLNTEKSALEKQLKEYEPKEGEERLKPAAIRKLKTSFEHLRAENERVMTELFKLKAAAAMSGPKALGVADEDEDEDAIDPKGQPQREEMCGDFEGVRVFTDKMLRFPYFSGAQKQVNTHEAILGSLTNDLDDYRRMMRLRVFVCGPTQTGKTAFLKCLTSASVPLMRSCPETVPTLQPQSSAFAVEDATTSKLDLFRRYVKFEEIKEEEPQKSGGVFGSTLNVFGGGSGVQDPAKVYLETIDFPGDQAYYRGLPAFLLPSKNVVFVITYNLTLPLGAIKEEISWYLRMLHAATSRQYPRIVGGDGARVAVCLVGTHRDAMRDSKDAFVVSYLNKITVSLGEEFFKLRGESTFGLTCIGNFAVSNRDWTVTSNRGVNGPQSYKDLCVFIATFSQRIYDNRPSALLPNSKESASFTTYMIGEERIEGPRERTAHLEAHEKRLRKGIVTLLTALQREQKVRWIMMDTELRTLAAEHLGIDESASGSAEIINYVVRELRVRNAITSLPAQIYEPRYLPRSDADRKPPRDGLIVIDPLRLLALYSSFIAGQFVPSQPPSIVKERAITQFDVAAFVKADNGNLAQGFLQQEGAQALLNRFIPLVGSDPRLMFELLCVMGLGVGQRTEVGLIAPCHFVAPMPAPLTEYLSFLVAMNGDGVGRRYQLNCCPSAFFSRLQALLVPFAHVPTRDPAQSWLKFRDGSFLVLDKARLRWGVYGSRTLKELAAASTVPVRGILKLEGNCLYVACTARSGSSKVAMDAARGFVEGIHQHIVGLCRREFRGITATFQEMVMAGVDAKRAHISESCRAVLRGAGASVPEVEAQLAALAGCRDATAADIDRAVAAIPEWMRTE